MARPLLIELGTEELPPKSLNELHRQFADNVCLCLTRERLEFGSVRAFATPRRLAVIVEDLAEAQSNQLVQKRGPAIATAFDVDGNPTRAATGFARSCGTRVEQLTRLVTDKGEWLCCNQVFPGEPTAKLLGEILKDSVKSLRYARGMRWGSSREAFIRPVQWLVILFGEELIECKLLGVQSSNQTRGHRFMGEALIPLSRPADFEKLLEENYVIAGFDDRQTLIEQSLGQLAILAGGRALIDPELLDEVTGMVEWPVVLSGEFDQGFLDVPSEVLISAMKTHQRYFPLLDDDGKLMPRFLFVANVAAPDPAVIRRGNERVIRSRLADAAFFFQQDQKTQLGQLTEQLEHMLFHRQLGSYLDKVERIGQLLEDLRVPLELSAEHARLAALLCKADLLSNMVREFPDLQGLMGYHYALAEGVPPQVAQAIRDHYMPTQAGGDLPQSILGSALAIADKLDTLTGLFAVGQAPTGSSDPFSLRRAALGIVRILVEKHLDLDLLPLVRQSAQRLLRSGADLEKTTQQVFHYLQDRLEHYFVEKGGERSLARAVYAPSLQTDLRILDAYRRMTALSEFVQETDAALLIITSKRVGNLLHRTKIVVSGISEDLFEEAEESLLWLSVQSSHTAIATLVAEARYKEALERMTELNTPIDNFFDKVLVMADNPMVRQNRLSLLHQVNGLFLQIADLSLISN